MKRIEKITEVMRKARLQKRQTWILSALIDIWDAEAKAQLTWDQRVESWVNFIK
ncbi:hypothetical protein OAA62_00975 [bacterium]|nr:hypothetical protein [bacterium]